MIKKTQPTRDARQPEPPKAGYVNVDREQYDFASELLDKYHGKRYAMDNVPSLVRRFLADFISELEKSENVPKAYDKAFKGMPHRHQLQQPESDENNNG